MNQQTPDQPEPATTHTFEFLGSTGDHPNFPGTDRFRCVHCDRELTETGIRNESGAIRRDTAATSGPAADQPCEHRKAPPAIAATNDRDGEDFPL